MSLLIMQSWLQISSQLSYKLKSSHIPVSYTHLQEGFTVNERLPDTLVDVAAVSYTHLDVYKRQYQR